MKNSKPIYYGFEYENRRARTTTGGRHSTPLHVAGALVAFPSVEERDDWAMGAIDREVIGSKDALPMGWNTELGWVAQGIDDASAEERWDVLYRYYPKTLGKRTPTPRLMLAQTEMGDPADSGEVPILLLDALEQGIFF